MRKKATELKYSRNTEAWKHLHNIFSSGRKNRGQLIFMLRGFIRKHSPEKWCESTVELFVRFAKAKSSDLFASKVGTLVEVFNQVGSDYTRQAVEAMRAFEVSQAKQPQRKISSSRLKPCDIIRIIADELEVEYGPWKAAA